MGFPGGAVVKNLPASTGDVGSILGLGRSPGEGNDNPCQYAWETPRTEEPGGLQSMGSQRIRHSLQIEHTCMLPNSAFSDATLVA